MAGQTAAGYPVNGEVVVTVQPDYSAAFLTLYAPQNGGRPVTREDVDAALLAKGVRYNIDEELLKDAVQNEYYDSEMRIAHADMPEDGVSGTITYKYSREHIFAPKEDEKGFVDYKNLGFVVPIMEGEVIAEITLPTAGTDGKDIRGAVMKAIPGKPANFNVGSGTKVSDDGLSLCASIDGHLVFRQNAFCVEPTVTINADVDASVGNIDFLGDIIIKGEIMEGFSVTSGKSITVAGNVTNAVLKAKGDILVKKGAINSTLQCDGDVKCEFAEYSNIHAQGNVSVQDAVICTIYCGGEMTAKSLSGGKYTVIGNAEAKYIGTKNYAPTEIIVGNNALLNAEKEELNKKISEYNVKIDRCTQVVDFLNEKRKQLKSLPEDKEELLGSMIRTKLSCQMDKKKAHKRIAEIESQLSEKQFASVICKGTVYPGVKITINDASTKFEDETSHVKIYLDEGGAIVTGRA